jgi:hypothetical protein
MGMTWIKPHLSPEEPIQVTPGAVISIQDGSILRVTSINDGLIITVNDGKGDAVPLTPWDFRGHGKERQPA